MHLNIDHGEFRTVKTELLYLLTNDLDSMIVSCSFLSREAWPVRQVLEHVFVCCFVLLLIVLFLFTTECATQSVKDENSSAADMLKPGQLYFCFLISYTLSIEESNHNLNNHNDCANFSCFPGPFVSRPSLCHWIRSRKFFCYFVNDFTGVWSGASLQVNTH